MKEVLHLKERYTHGLLSFSAIRPTDLSLFFGENRSEAMRLGQRLVDNHHLKEVDTSHVYFQDADDATYIFSREAVTVMSLYSASKKVFPPPPFS